MLQHEAAFFVGQEEFLNSRDEVDEDELGANGAAIADLQQNHFGRAPTQDVFWRKSESLETMANPFSAAYFQMFSSEAPRSPQSRKWQEPG